MWIIRGLDVSKDDNFFENIRLENGSPLRLFDLDLAHRTFGFHAPTLFCTINYFLCDEPGFMIAKADTHLYTRTSKHIMQIPPSFIITIPKKLVHPGDHTYISDEPTIGHFYQNSSGKCMFQRPLRVWKGNPDWEVPDKRNIEKWFKKGQREMGMHWKNHWKGTGDEERWSFGEDNVS